MSQATGGGSVIPEAVPAPALPAPAGGRARARRFLLGLGIVVLLAAPAAIVLAGAWKETRLREAGLPELEALAQRHPTDGRLLTLLGARLAEARDFPAAAAMLERAVSAGDSGPEVWLTWAAAVAAAGDPGEARAVLRLGIARNPPADDLRRSLARAEQLGMHPAPADHARAICPEGIGLLAADRARGSFLNFVAEFQGRRDPPRSGFATRQAWARQEPDNPRVQTLWAGALLRNRRTGEAETVARRAVSLAPDSPEAHLALGDALMAGGASGKAGLEYTTCLRLRPEWLPALLGLGAVALEKKLLPIGIDVYEKATKQAPRSADAWVGLGRAYYNQRLRWGQSLAAFDRAAVIDPARTDFYADYANALRANFQYDRAESVLRRRIAAAPDDAESRYLLALVLLDHGPTAEREAEAESEFRHSLELNPRSAAAQARLGQLLLRRGRTQQAIACLEASLRLDPYRVSALLNLSRAYRAVGRLREARQAQQSLADLTKYTQRVAVLEDMTHREPLNPRHHEELASWYERGREFEKAARSREMAYMLRAHRAAAERGLTALKAATSTTIPARDGR